jgi:hypothetical protein
MEPSRDPGASSLCSRPGTGLPLPRKIWKHKTCGLLSHQRIWPSFIPPVPFSSGMGCERRATTALVFTCRGMLKMASLKRIGPCSSTGSEACAMPISTLSRPCPRWKKCRRALIWQRDSWKGWRGYSRGREAKKDKHLSAESPSRTRGPAPGAKGREIWHWPGNRHLLYNTVISA